MKLSRLFEISIWKTVRFNAHYFGVTSIYRPRVLVSKNVKIEKLGGDVELSNNRIGSVKLGFKSVPLFDFKYSRFRWQNDGKVAFGDNVNIGQGAVISNSGNLNLGDNFNISAESMIVCRKEITIQNDCLFSWKCMIMDSDWHKIIDNDTGTIVNSDETVVIGNHVWIGANSLILKGTSISDDTVIAAGSVVSGKIKDGNSVYVDRRAIKRNINWKY